MSPWKLPPELEEKREELTNMLNIAEGVIMASLNFIEAVSEEYNRPLTPDEYGLSDPELERAQSMAIR